MFHPWNVSIPEDFWSKNKQILKTNEQVISWFLGWGDVPVQRLQAKKVMTSIFSWQCWQYQINGGTGWLTFYVNTCPIFSAEILIFLLNQRYGGTAALEARNYECHLANQEQFQSLWHTGQFTLLFLSAGSERWYWSWKVGDLTGQDAEYGEAKPSNKAAAEAMRGARNRLIETKGAIWRKSKNSGNSETESVMGTKYKGKLVETQNTNVNKYWNRIQNLAQKWEVWITKQNLWEPNSCCRAEPVNKKVSLKLSASTFSLSTTDFQ